MRAKRFTLSQTYQGEWILGCVLQKESVRDAMNLVDSPEADYDVDIKKHRERRSLTANAYFHVLCSKLANELNADMETVKKSLVKRYGVMEAVTIKLPRGVDAEKYYPYVSWIGGDDANDIYALYKETHRLDSKEFSVLLDGTISECKLLGIETLPQDELERLYAQADKVKGNQ